MSLRTVPCGNLLFLTIYYAYTLEKRATACGLEKVLTASVRSTPERGENIILRLLYLTNSQDRHGRCSTMTVSHHSLQPGILFVKLETAACMDGKRFFIQGLLYLWMKDQLQYRP